MCASMLLVSECLCTTEEVQIPLNPTGCAGFQRAGKAIAACSQDKLSMMKVESQLKESSRLCNLDFFFFSESLAQAQNIQLNALN